MNHTLKTPDSHENVPVGTCEIFEQIFHHGPIAMIQQDHQGKIIAANSHVTELFGVNAVRLVGHKFQKPEWSMFDAEGTDLPEPQWAFQRVVEQVTTLKDCLQIIRCPNGVEKSLNISGFPLRNTKGELDHFIFTLQDMTEKENLREELEEYTTLLDATGRMARVGGWELILATNEVRWTKETYRIHEVPIGDDISLEKALSFFHPEDLPVLQQALEDARHKGKPYDLVLRITTAKGNERYTRGICTPVMVEGKVVRLRGTFQDITQQKKMEHALQESENRYRRVAENSPAVAAQYRMDTDGNTCFLFITDTVRDMLGVPAETVMRDASTVLRLIHPDDLEGYQRASMGSFQNLSEFQYELRVIKPDGEECWIEIHSVPEEQPDGSVIWDGFFQEITERKRAEKQLILQHDLLRIAGETSRFGGWAVDLVNNTHFWSDTVKRIHEMPENYEPSLEEGIRFYAPESRDQITKVFTACAEKGIPYNEELELITATGKRIWVRTCGRADVDATGTITGVHGSFQDITEERKLEEQLRTSEKMEVVGKLAGGIAHDFNNQLAVTLGFAELLQTQVKDPDQKQYVKNIISAANRSADLTQKILVFARKHPFQKITVDVHDVIDDTMDILEHTMDKRIRIQKHLSANHAILSGDPQSIQTGLINVCLNASEAMPEGGTLGISTEVVDVDKAFAETHKIHLQNGPHLVLSVTDSGCGISKTVLPHVFEPFFTTKPLVEGAGMGLSAVYGMIKAHGGDVVIQSEEGQGTSVSLYFPLSLKDQEEVSGTPKTAKQDGRPSLRILVVDDEELVRNLLSQLLEHSGHSTVKVSCGHAALERYREEWRHIDLILLDMMMPDIDGDETFLRLKEINPDARVILMSGYCLDTHSQRVLDAGAKGFLQKPFSSTGLLNEINRIIH